MNRPTRRALARAHGRQQKKLTHRLPPQACVLFVPKLRAYVAEFSPDSIRLIELPELARIYTDDEVTAVASRFREVTGCRVEVRPLLAPYPLADAASPISIATRLAPRPA